MKKILHLNVHTPNSALYAKIKDGGLGLTNFKGSIPEIFLKRLSKLSQSEAEDTSLSFVMQSDRTVNLMRRLNEMMGAQPPAMYWASSIKDCPLLKGVETAAEDPASRAWIDAKPHGCNLRTANLPTMGLPSNPPEQRSCRAGCNKVESISHVLQGCPSTHW